MIGKAVVIAMGKHHCNKDSIRGRNIRRLGKIENGPFNVYKRNVAPKD